MNKARETILRLVAEGKISVEEAEELLKAIEGGSGNLFNDFFDAKRAHAGAQARAKGARAREAGTRARAKGARAREAGARSRAKASRAKEDKRYHHEYNYDYKFHFPWNQPDWQWPWEQQDWQWPWEKEGATRPKSVFEVPEGALLKIRQGGGDLAIQGTDDETSLRLTDPHAASKVTMKDKEIHISSGGFGLGIEVPAKVASIEVTQNGGNMNVERLNADLTARVVGGNMSVSKATGKIQALVEGGDVWLADIKSTEAQVKTHGGSISLNMLPTVEEGTINLSADWSRISLVLPPDSRCQIVANAPDGRIGHSLPPESVEIIEETDTYLNARLNGGGADFILSAKMGDITVKA